MRRRMGHLVGSRYLFAQASARILLNDKLSCENFTLKAHSRNIISFYHKNHKKSHSGGVCKCDVFGKSGGLSQGRIGRAVEEAD